MDNKSKKQRIRQDMKEFRNEMDVFTIESLSNENFRNFRSLDLQNKDTYFVYNSFGNEVKTNKIIEYLLECEKKVYMPKIVGQSMFSVRIFKDTKFIKNSFGIMEPMGEIEKINDFVAIIPCLAVDIKGNRIGYGGGYYDKFLENKKAMKIALCYDFQILEELPYEEFDKRLDFIVTDKRILKIHSQNEKSK